MKTDNSTAQGILTGTIKQQRSKAIDMWFYWLKDRAAQKQFHIHWKRGASNLADYYTKHFPPSYHQRIRSQYILKGHWKVQISIFTFKNEQEW